MTVYGDRTSGEIEPVLIIIDGRPRYLGVGSDHTDRDVETKSIPGSKQMYAKVLAPECWPFADVKEHWDQLILRCWVSKGADRALYQEAPLASILGPQNVLEKMPALGEGKEHGVVLFSGTVATKSGLVYGDSFELEIEDPVLKRSIRHSYRARILPQYV